LGEEINKYLPHVSEHKPRYKSLLMNDCELLEKCPFFNDKLKDMPTASDMMKKIYCQWHYKECARYKVAGVVGKDRVPSDLFPSDKERAAVLLA
jgi:hypothetical protein